MLAGSVLCEECVYTFASLKLHRTRLGHGLRAKRGGGGRTRTYEGVSQRIYSPPPLPLGTLPRNAGIIRAGAIWLDGEA